MKYLRPIGSLKSCASMRKTPFIDFSYIIGQWVWPWKQTGVFWLRKFASAWRLSKT